MRVGLTRCQVVSPVLVVDGSRTAVKRGQFTEENIRPASAFTGGLWDAEIGLYYFCARYYEPSFGRFLSLDPVGFQGGINWYAYVGNNPVRLTDRLGLCPPSPSDGGFLAQTRVCIGKIEGLPVFRSTLRASSAAQSGPTGQEACREDETVFGRANHCGSAASRVRDSRRRRMPTDWDLRADVLPLEEDVRGHVAERGPRAEAAARGKHEVKAPSGRPHLGQGHAAGHR